MKIKYIETGIFEIHSFLRPTILYQGYTEPEAMADYIRRISSKSKV